jgi:hypothetical protein
MVSVMADTSGPRETKNGHSQQESRAPARRKARAQEGRQGGRQEDHQDGRRPKEPGQARFGAGGTQICIAGQTRPGGKIQN